MTRPARDRGRIADGSSDRVERIQSGEDEMRRRRGPAQGGTVGGGHCGVLFVGVVTGSAIAVDDRSRRPTRHRLDTVGDRLVPAAATSCRRRACHVSRKVAALPGIPTSDSGALPDSRGPREPQRRHRRLRTPRPLAGGHHRRHRSLGAASPIRCCGSTTAPATGSSPTGCATSPRSTWRLNEHRDVITLDLRGTGLAEPVLTCPEVTELEHRRLRCRDRRDHARGPGDAPRRRRAVPRPPGRRRRRPVRLRRRRRRPRSRRSARRARCRAVEHRRRRVRQQARPDPRPRPPRGRPYRRRQLHPDPVAGRLVRRPRRQRRPRLGRRSSPPAPPTPAAHRPSPTSPTASRPSSPTSPPTLVTTTTCRPTTAPDEPFLMTASRLLAVRPLLRPRHQLPRRRADAASPGLPGRPDAVLQTFDPDDPDTLISQATDLSCCGACVGTVGAGPAERGHRFGSRSRWVHTCRRCAATKPRSPTPQALAAAADVPLFGPFLGHHADLEACDVWAVEPAPTGGQRTGGQRRAVPRPRRRPRHGLVAGVGRRLRRRSQRRPDHPLPRCRDPTHWRPAIDRADLCPPDPRPVPRRPDHTRRRLLRRHVPRQALLPALTASPAGRRRPRSAPTASTPCRRPRRPRRGSSRDVSAWSRRRHQSDRTGRRGGES